MNEQFFGTENNKLTLLSPFDHKEAEDDDCGLPEHPIYSNYSKYLWKKHIRSGGVQVRNIDDTAGVNNTKIISGKTKIM